MRLKIGVTILGKGRVKIPALYWSVISAWSQAGKFTRLVLEHYFGKVEENGPGHYVQSVKTGIGRLVAGGWRGAVGRGGYPPLTVWRLALRQFPNQRRTNAELTQRCGWLAVLLSGGWPMSSGWLVYL